MDGFTIFDSNLGEYDEHTEVRESRLYDVGWSVKLIEYAGKLSPPYPVLVS